MTSATRPMPRSWRLLPECPLPANQGLAGAITRMRGLRSRTCEGPLRWAFAISDPNSQRPRPAANASAISALIGSEVIVDAGGDHIGAEARRVRDRRDQGIGRRAAAQIEIKIFDLGAPAPGERNFDASAQRPAVPRLAAIVGGGEAPVGGGRGRACLAEGAPPVA